MKAPSLTAPYWVTDPWFNADPLGQRLAIMRYNMPVVTGAERYRIKTLEEKHAAKPPAPTHACSGCGLFAFPQPTICFWCQRRQP